MRSRGRARPSPGAERPLSAGRRAAGRRRAGRPPAGSRSRRAPAAPGRRRAATRAGRRSRAEFAEPHVVLEEVVAEDRVAGIALHASEAARERRVEGRDEPGEGERQVEAELRRRAPPGPPRGHAASGGGIPRPAPGGVAAGGRPSGAVAGGISSSVVEARAAGGMIPRMPRVRRGRRTVRAGSADPRLVCLRSRPPMHDRSQEVGDIPPGHFGLEEYLSIAEGGRGVEPPRGGVAISG